MTHTANDFNQIMTMPIKSFLGIVKHIQMEELMQNPEWREKYFKFKFEEQYKQGHVNGQKSCDIAGLQAFADNL